MVESVDFLPIINSPVIKNQLDRIPLPLQQMVTNYERKCLAILGLGVHKESAILEFGTWRGLTTSYLAQVFPTRMVYTINPDPMQCNKHQKSEMIPHDEIGMECRHFPNVKIIYKDSLDVDLEKEGITDLSMVFVDGAHDFAHVYADCEKATKLLKGGGVLAVHNFNINHTADLRTVDDYVEGGICYYVQTTPGKWKHIKDTVIVYRYID